MYRSVTCIIGILCFLLIEGSVQAQHENDYEEISVLLNIQQLGNIDIPAVIRNQEVFLPVTEMFDILKIKNTSTQKFDSVSGFFINPIATYLIDYPNHRIKYLGKVYELKMNDLIRTESDLYLKVNYFGEIFGLNCQFKFRSLSVELTTLLELPVIKELRLEQIRSNMNKLKGEIKPDTVIKRGYPAFHFGMTDWSIIGTQQVQGPTDTRATLGLGGIIAGGEANVLLNYSTSEPFLERQQQYLWRFANNDNTFLKQAIAGKINSQATSTIYDPVVGVQFTNTPTTYRRSFGSYLLADYTKPGWIVELYVNNVLVNYTKADASGFYRFDVPLVYGNTEVKLRFYGPYGEEISSQKIINIPFNFLPSKDLEYTVSGGIVEDNASSRYAKANLNYGLNKRLTIGGGVEYLSSVTSGNTMPFLDFSLRIASSLLISSEYTYGVRWKSILSYRLPSNFQIDLNYIKYVPGQTAINYNYLEERKAVLSYPLRAKNFSSYFRLTVDQIILPISQYTTAEFLFSGGFFGINTNLTTYALFFSPGNPNVYSNLSLGFRLPKGFTLTPQIQYNYNLNQLISVKCELEKRIFKNGAVDAIYERNIPSDINSAQLGFRYDFAFARTGVLVRQSYNSTTLVESAQGGLVLDAKTKYFSANNNTNVGRGGIVIVPFLDYNGNGHRDKDEPKVFGMEISMTGGRVEQNKKDSTIRVFNLEPYINYFVSLNPNSFDNIAWKIRNPIISVTVDPNQFKLIEVPVAIVGEAAGMVYLMENMTQKGQGRMILKFYRKDSVLIAKTVTEPDGYFNYLGLPPGSYFATIDPNQLHKLNMKVSPASIPFTIKKSRDGDVADGMEFFIRSMNEDTISRIQSESKDNSNNHLSLPKKEEQVNTTIINQPKKDSVKTGQKTLPALKLEKPAEPEKKSVIQESIIIPKTTSVSVSPHSLDSLEYVIQVGSFHNESYAISAQNHLSKALNRRVDIDHEGEFYKVRVALFKDINEAKALLPKIISEGFQQAFITKRNKR
jgi:hypothetical protein